MRASMVPFQHVTVALFIFLYCALRTIGHARAATLVRLPVA
jgi:hypothetical protein